MNRPHVLEEEEIEWLRQNNKFFGPNRVRWKPTLKEFLYDVRSAFSHLCTGKYPPRSSSDYFLQRIQHIQKGLELGTIPLEFPDQEEDLP